MRGNDSARFECRWVWLEADPASPCVFTRELSEPIHCPVAHGEGKVAFRDDAVREAVQAQHLGALRYTAPDGGPATYPHNPNGSEFDLAGLTNPAGNVLGPLILGAIADAVSVTAAFAVAGTVLLATAAVVSLGARQLRTLSS